MNLLRIVICVLLLYSCTAVNNTAAKENTSMKEEKKVAAKTIEAAVQEAPIAIYDSHTRGYHFTFTVYGTYATVINEYRGKPVEVAVLTKDIKELMLLINAISEQEIATYEAPTKKRNFDAAPHTTISIFKKGEKYSSQVFDGGFPPKALEVLVNKVLSLSPEK